ncbi:MAG: hypothetical protein BM557_05510 [Flavobacterium sp. MedPE-SWcel]|uniref:hypothetical protein n=1 Tax=uncultured Flavobacterium sp. TaxID=165435 RepID=UPI0009193BD6|nr:hypothetical protein [uncultured Flavobacterium sp.]OIQ20129.1 MAG: hypothetical protein BM557_05510 [Flavobacterium sp. MedPE-SWcel]
MKRKKSLPTPTLLGRVSQEKYFLILILAVFILSALFYGQPQIAMWIGFFTAAYATVSNDSIQSLGTFIESNKDKKWYWLWLFTGTIFLVTVTISWVMYDGDVTYKRLLDPETGLSNYPHPDNFSFLILMAPLVLLILTRLKMPVSTTFLMLSVFSSSSKGITTMISKSVSGYFIAFIVSALVWYFGYNYIKKKFKSRKVHPMWMVAQWLVSGTLWAVWVMQDGANIAVFLPRKLDGLQFGIFSAAIFIGLGLLFFLRGDKIQEVVSEKVRISDIRAATLVDFTYALILVYKLFISTVPMSTTWIFLGLIGGREIAINLARLKKGKKHKKKALRMIGKDFLFAAIGLTISLILAASVNAAIRNDLMIFLGLK